MEKNAKEIIVTGIRPTGDLHIGNYLGAVKPLLEVLEANKEAEVFIFVADLHGHLINFPLVLVLFRVR